MWTMRTTGARKIFLTAAAMLTLGGSAYAQKKSDDDGVRLITQKDANEESITTDDTAGFPVTISESGSYRLGSHLILPDGDTTGIEITAATLTVDLNGFSCAVRKV